MKDTVYSPECDMRTLMEAEIIKKDPKRLKAAKEAAKKNAKMSMSIADIEEAYSKKVKGDMMEESEDEYEED